MKIGFDVSDLCTGRADGTTRYTKELAMRMPALKPEQDWFYFAPCSSDPSVPRHGLPAGRQARDTSPSQGEEKRLSPPLEGGVPEGRGGQLQRSNVSWHASPWPQGWTQTRLPFDLYRYKPDVMFMPIQQIPYLRPQKTKMVAVVHDLAVHRYPEQFRYKDWLLLHVFSAHAVREADEIIAVSRATADDIARYYGRTKNVHVIHHGVDHERFRAPGEAEQEGSWGQLKSLYPDLKKPFVLYVGQLQPRKNLVRLIEAFEQLRRSETELQLVLAGGEGWLKKPIFTAINSSTEVKNILALGVVPDSLLPALYWQAEVFVLPSLYEGFGMPILEAFACGCPVVTSNVSSMPEVAGGAAVLVNPTSVESMTAGIKEALGSQEDLRKQGWERAREFDWDVTARKVLEVLL